MDTLCGVNMIEVAGKEQMRVSSLNPKGAAAGCGLQVGDVLLSINGMRVTSYEQGAMLLKSAEGEVTLRATRPVVTVQIPTEKTFTFNKPTMDMLCGVTLATCAGKDETRVSFLNPNGVAAGCGLMVGDVLLSINGLRVTSLEQALMLLKSVEGEVTLRATRLVASQAEETSVKPAALESLIEMGFSRDQSINALRMAQGSVDVAAARLLDSKPAGQATKPKLAGRPVGMPPSLMARTSSLVSAQL
jgi:predicted metalloprotease with PDZ domain